MAQITDYSSLQSEIAEELNRTDLTNFIPRFIQFAEAQFRRDTRTRKIQNRTTFTVSNRDTSLPSDFREMVALYHDGDTYYGPIEIVPAGELSIYRHRYDDTGVPRAGAIINKETLRLAPVPDEAYTLRMLYDREITSLSSSNTTNWLLDDHPDIYLYGSLVHSAPFLKEDERIQTWNGMLEKALNELKRSTTRGEYSSNLVRKPRAPIG